jgi:uncharacterized protein YukE
MSDESVLAADPEALAGAAAAVRAAAARIRAEVDDVGVWASRLAGQPAFGPKQMILVHVAAWDGAARRLTDKMEWLAVVLAGTAASYRRVDAEAAGYWTAPTE